jgi:ABC-2 type transport system ATP-binding protein
MLRLERVSHAYGRGTPALDCVDVSFQPGITGLVGANGAGKSTLMRVASGALRPTSGAALVAGSDLYRRGARREALGRVAWMPQVGEYPRSLTALEFVTYITWLRGVGRQEASRRARESLAAVEMGKFEDRKMKALSGGMVRRVWLAQAMAARADVLLLDEPSTGLDPRQRSTMVRLLAAQRAGTVVLSSHVLEDVAELADRVVVLDQGRVIYDGPTPQGLGADWFLALVPQEGR